MSTPVFVDPESSTQADGAQSSRVPVPLPEDPYEARLIWMGRTLSSSLSRTLLILRHLSQALAITPPIPLFESTPPILVPILRRTARMAVRIPPVMLSGLSASITRMAAMSESTVCTSELVEDSEEDDDEEDEETEESVDSDSVSEDAEDEGPTKEDKDPTTEDEGLTTGVEGPDMDDEGYGLDDESRVIDEESHSVESDRLDLEEEEEAVPGGQQQATLVVGIADFRSAPESGRPERVSAFRQPTLTTWTNPEDGMIYIDILDYPPPAPPVQTPPSPEWTSGLLTIFPSHFDVPSPISTPMIPLTVLSPKATPAAVKTEGFLTELQVEMQGGLIRDHAVRLQKLPPALFKRYDRDIRELFTRSGAIREEIFS
ncbi:hypothetical protein Tco_0852634 [Tanacetum coccineum]